MTTKPLNLLPAILFCEIRAKQIKRSRRKLRHQLLRLRIKTFLRSLEIRSL